MDRYRITAPAAVTGCAHMGTRRWAYSPTPSRANPRTTPRTIRPVSPIQSLSKASFRKKPMPTTRATAPMMANQLRPQQPLPVEGRGEYGPTAAIGRVIGSNLGCLDCLKHWGNRGNRLYRRRGHVDRCLFGVWASQLRSGLRTLRGGCRLLPRRSFGFIIHPIDAALESQQATGGVLEDGAQLVDLVLEFLPGREVRIRRGIARDPGRAWAMRFRNWCRTARHGSS